ARYARVLGDARRSASGPLFFGSAFWFFRFLFSILTAAQYRHITYIVSNETSGHSGFPVKDRKLIEGSELASLAKQAREAAGKTRQQAATDMGVSWASIFQAEEEPQRSLVELRVRMIERYAGLRVEGPLFRLTRTRSTRRKQVPTSDSEDSL